MAFTHACKPLSVSALGAALVVAVVLCVLSSASSKLVVYADAHYHGHSIHTSHNLPWFGVHHFSDKASSVKVTPGEVWILYRDAHFQGPSITVDRDIPWLGVLHFNDKVSSAKRIPSQCYQGYGY